MWFRRLLGVSPNRIFTGWAIFFATGCALVQSPAERLHEIAGSARMMAVDLPDARLKAFLRSPAAAASQHLTVYIESDGAPWPWPDTPPADPSPVKPLVVGLAALDTAPSVGYLSRLCQYLTEAERAKCDVAYWTSGRFREDAVAATMIAIDNLKRASRAKDVSLVGYSGGGVMAALVAARRDDVRCLVTIAAPLDIDAWADSIRVSRLYGSRNPVDAVRHLAATPQTHFRGLADKAVPPGSARRFLLGVPGAQVADLPEFDHECCWLRDWPSLRRRSCLAG